MMKALLSCVLILNLLSCASRLPERQAEEAPSREDALLRRFAGATDGTWQGSFDITSPTPEPITKMLVLCFTISNDEVRASIFEDGKWKPLKPFTFKSISYGPSQLIYSLDGGETAGGGPWVEAWTISFTTIGPDVGVVRTSRLVNNVDVPLDHADRAYSFSGEGKMKRVHACS
ncbi:MAG: hypothetical protein KF790_12920 [Steroidobacteraceae bacterium]|nr:hypothetical protein [Steroidobacteraceae bacterium]MCW5573005.1 hypothetical protein [Steroidobacteraceae bacterium]